MNYELTLASAIILFWTYVLTTCKIGGVPYCLSETFYTLGRRWRFIFPIFQFSMAAILGYQLHSLHLSYAWIGWVLTASIAGVGLVPDFRRSWQHPIHYAFTVCSMLCITTLCILAGLWYLPILVTLSSLRRNWLLGLEIGFYTIGFIYLIVING